MKRTLGVLALAGCVLSMVVWQVRGQQTGGPGREQLKPFMQQKLDHAKAVLAAIAVEDHEGLAKAAQDLSLLSLESNWNVMTTDEYIQQSADFRRACRVIQEAAHAKNIDRAALGFVDLTVRCVECHKYMRSGSASSRTKP